MQLRMKAVCVNEKDVEVRMIFPIQEKDLMLCLTFSYR